MPSSSSPIGVSRLIALHDLEHLADLFQRHTEAHGEFLRRRLAADFVEDLAGALALMVLIMAPGYGWCAPGQRSARDRLADPQVA